MRLYFYGESPIANILVMELLGPTIEGRLLKFYSEILVNKLYWFIRFLLGSPKKICSHIVKGNFL